MKTLTRKSEITAKELKLNDVIFKGNRLGFDKNSRYYFIGNPFHGAKYSYHETISDLKLYI